MLPRLLTILLLITHTAFAEGGGAWTRKAVVEESAALCDHVESEAKERAARLLRESGTVYEMKFTFPSADEKDLLRFADRWKQKRITGDDVKGRWKDLLRITAELSAAEAAARPKWLEKMKPTVEAEAAEKTGEIYRTKIQARRLGAILDRSSSMAKYLPALRKEIAHTFEDYPNVEIWGSSLRTHRVNHFKTFPAGYLLQKADTEIVDIRWYALSPGDADDPFDPAWHFPHQPTVSEEKLSGFSATAEKDNASAIRGMVELHKVDVIYWFCDLRDDVDDDTVRRLAKVLLEKKVKLYIHTVGRKPKGLLETLVKQSGGSVITDKPRLIAAEKPKAQ